MNPDKIRNVLNILFMILALAAIIKPGHLKIKKRSYDERRNNQARESGL